MYSYPSYVQQPPVHYNRIPVYNQQQPRNRTHNDPLLQTTANCASHQQSHTVATNNNLSSTMRPRQEKQLNLSLISDYSPPNPNNHSFTANRLLPSQYGLGTKSSSMLINGGVGFMLPNNAPPILNYNLGPNYNPQTTARQHRQPSLINIAPFNEHEDQSPKKEPTIIANTPKEYSREKPPDSIFKKKSNNLKYSTHSTQVTDNGENVENSMNPNARTNLYLKRLSLHEKSPEELKGNELNREILKEFLKDINPSIVNSICSHLTED